MDQDYDLALCKVPRKDKSGKDITKDKIGKGGRHRDDGTYSGPVYDIEVLSDRPKQVAPVRSPAHVKKTPQQVNQTVTKDELPWWGQIIVDVAEEVVPIISQKLTYMAIDSFDRWMDNRKNKKAKGKSAVVKSTPVTKAERILIERELASHECNTISRPRTDMNAVQISSDFNDAYHHYSANMTSEEAQKELIDAFILQIIAIRKIQKVAAANITSPSGELLSGKKVIESVYRPELIGQINTILMENPTLIDNWQSMLLADILQRDIVVDGKYLPINSVELESKLR